MTLIPSHDAADVILRRQALSAGHSDRSIQELLRRGIWHRIRWGAYIDSVTWASFDESQRHHVRARAVLLQSKTSLVISHGSAVAAHGGPTWSLALDEVHVTRPDGKAGRAEAGVRQHRGRLRPEDLVSYAWGQVTNPTKTALDLTTVASTEASLCVVNHFLHTDQTSFDTLRSRYRSMDLDPRTLATDLVLRLADPRIESVGESRTYYLCWDQGLPAPEPQWEVMVHGRVLARLDFAWPQLGVWVEFDGREKYVKYLKEGESVTDVVLREKRREERITEVTGWRCVRVTWADLAYPERTAQRIRAQMATSAA